MLTFTIDILTEDKNYIERNGSAFGIDKNGKEYEITPQVVNQYYNKYGGKWKPLAWMAAGALGGGAIGLPISIATGGTSTPVVRYGAYYPFTIGGMYLGLSHAQKNLYNDIVAKRKAGEF